MLYEIARSVLFKMQPETAHNVIMSNIDWASACGLTRLVSGAVVSDPVKVMGLTFPNTIGLAAGMDKTASHVTAFGKLGFGHIEVGTITPRPQAGNPKPRCWRLIPAQGVVNWMGFNNCGVEQAKINLRSADEFRRNGGILGINIGKQNSSPLSNALQDYCFCLDNLYDAADYFAIDISCPNTPELTKLQGCSELNGLVSGLAERRKMLADKFGRYVPMTVKISPDLDDDAVRSAADVFVQYGMDAVTATNTTTSRKGVEHLPAAANKGGLSGRPLFERSTAVVKVLAEHLKGELPIIASGGVMSAEDAVTKMESGVSLVQLYTGFIYKGPALINDAAAAIRDWHA
jgi:dihydroorotate dehydrogenase